MNVLYDAFAVLGGILLIAGVFWWCAKHAPFGWQDENGWHPGTPKDEDYEQ